MAELKPCPFCGEIGTSLLEGSTYRWAVMACSHCEARAPEVRKERIGPGFCDQDEIDAREEWNRRPSVPPVGEREFRLAEAVVYLLGDLHEVKDDKPDGWADSIVAEARAILSSPAPDPPVSERERRIAETIQDYLDCYDEADRCFGCDNDAGREHAEDCTEAPRIKEARAWADSILSSPAPDPASEPRALIELGSCKDDDDCYTFIVALANTEEDDNRDEEAPILYSGEYPTEADRDEAASRVAAALGLQVKESR